MDECRLAAAELSRLSGRPGAEVLSGVERSAFDRFESELQPHIRRRATHFFSESQRVMDGLTAWNQGDVETFGKLMNLSCKSSIEQYECGVPAVCDLQQIVSGSGGVYGSRFMGGGFGGCVVGLARSSHASVIAEEIETTYRKLHPEVAEQAFVRLSRSDDGVRFI